MNNIILTGFMAVGKSTIGRSLGALMHYRYLDTDRMIEKKEKKEIKDIFVDSGEPYFRQLEREVIAYLKGTSRKVVSTGGGLFLDERNREQLLEEDFVVFLTLPMEEIYERIQRNDRRPLAKKASVEELEERYQERLPYYMEAHKVVDTQGKNPFQIAREIKREYHRWMEKGK